MEAAGIASSRASLPAARSRGTGARLLARLIGLCLFFALSTSQVAAVQNAAGITTSHGYAVFGTLKYPAGWTHLDYVNPDAPKGGTYRYAQFGTYDSMNYFAVIGTAPFLLTFIFDSLMQRSLDEPASYYGLIAESISYPKDFAWAEFRMRPQARWHDGKPITPEDVIFTVETFRGMVAPAYRRIGQSIAKVEKTGPHSVRVHFVMKNNPTMPSIIAQMPVLPKHWFATRDFTRPTLEPPLASGPYKVGRFSAGRWIELERVKDYWAANLPINKGRFNFDIIRHDYYRDASVIQEVFLNGQSDLRSEASAVRWASQDKLPVFKSGNIRRVDIAYSNGAYYQGITLNTRKPALADRRVRKAIMLAFDYEWVVRVLLAGHHGRVRSYFANTPFASEDSLPSAEERALLEPFRKELPPEVFTGPPELPVGGTWQRRRRNLIEAASLLRQAGYRVRDGKLIDPRTGRPMMLSLTTGSVLYDRQVALFIENMRQLGIEVQFRAFDSASFRRRLRNHDFDMALAGPQFAPLAAPGLELLQAWSSKAADMPATTNYAGVRSPAIDSLVDTIIKAKERHTVVAAMRALDRVALWNYYSVPFQHIYPAPVGHNPISYWDKFGRPAKEPNYYFPLLMMEHWWVDPAREARLRYGVYGQRRR